MKRILWITNIMFPPVCKIHNRVSPVVGGWMYSSAKSLLEVSNEIELAVATVYDGKFLVKEKIEHITYYLLPMKGSMSQYNADIESYWIQVYQDFKPNIVHLHGTEYAHGLAFLKVLPQVHSVVSLQGLVSVIPRYFLAGVTVKDIFHCLTIYDLIKGNLLYKKRLYEKAAKNEIEIIKNVNNIIGRTEWDKVHSWAINPHAHYYYCNETLRDVFYNKTWKYDKCEHRTIFISQAGYPLKGFHILLKALPFVLKFFPDTKVYVAGSNITKYSTIKGFLHYTGYARYLNRLIKQNHLDKYIYFTGPLTEEEMCKRFLQSNLFVCPSSIENSPNSLAEAQILGMPCLASYVGGVPDMMRSDEEHLYRYDDYEMLAYKICQVFCNKSITENMKIQKIAQKRHDKKENAKVLLNLYSKVLIE